MKTARDRLLPVKINNRLIYFTRLVKIGNHQSMTRRLHYFTRLVKIGNHQSMTRRLILQKVIKKFIVFHVKIV